MAKIALTVVFMSLCASVLCGCAYCEDRARDTTDMITVAGEFPMIGGAVWVGRWGAVVSGGEGQGLGLRSGAVGVYRFSEGGFIFIGLKDLEPSEADRARGKGYQAGFPLDEHCGGGLRGGWFNLGQVEVVAGVGPGVRAGVNIFEIADFVLGWASIDICDDDVASLPELSALRKAGLRSRADIDGAWRDGATRLHLASKKGDVDRVKLLLEGGANVHAVRKDGMTALHLAALYGHMEVVRLLLEKGADVCAVTPEGMAPTYMALHAGHADIALLLLAAGADVKATTSDGFTLLYTAAERGNVRFVKALLEAGVDVNATEKTGGCSALHVASEGGHTDIVVLLLQAKADVNAVTKDGITPVYWASQKGHVDTVKLLLEAGADANAGSWQGSTALAAAREAGHAEVVELLRKHGAKE